MTMTMTMTTEVRMSRLVVCLFSPVTYRNSLKWIVSISVYIEHFCSEKQSDVSSCFAGLYAHIPKYN